jgi:precorrin-4/cobalt-precorrin-4 C11-methyltransferase
MHLSQVIAAMEEGFHAGKKVVRLHTGDPSLYGAIHEQMAELRRRRIPCAVIPGVTAAFAAAASLGIEFTLPEISQTLILTRMAGRTPVPESENLAGLAAHRASMAIYLSMSRIEAVADILSREYGADAPCAVVYRASQPGEKIIRTRLKELSEKVQAADIARQAVVIVGRVLEVGPQDLTTSSRLYDQDFEHGFRK